MTEDMPITEAPHIAGILSNVSETMRPSSDRARGTVLGLAAGNLLGLPVEGWLASSISGAFPRGVSEIDPGERSSPMDDDLAQAVELAEALLEGGEYVANFARRLVRWRRQNGRGIGITTSAVIDLLEEGHSPPEAARIIYEERCHIAPNGGLMRCAPVALARHSEAAILIRDSATTCAVTHYAPACQWSCIIINAAISMMLKGVDPPVRDLVSAAMSDGAPAEIGEWAARVGADIDDLALDQGHIGHTLLCMRAGLWALTTPVDLESALIRIVSAGGDTDTNGAVAGAALGARYGASAIPQRWLDCIPQRERLESLALKLVNAAIH